MEKIQKFLEEHIKKKGIKQALIAESTGMSKNAVSQGLSGKRKIHADEFLKICRVLEIPAADIDELISDIPMQINNEAKEVKQC